MSLHLCQLDRRQLLRAVFGATSAFLPTDLRGVTGARAQGLINTLQQFGPGGNFVTFESKGAAGDGSADDTAALNSAFAAGNGFATGVTATAGKTYKTSNNLLIPSGGINLYLPGGATITSTLVAGGTSAIIQNQSYLARLPKVTITGGILTKPDNTYAGRLIDLHANNIILDGIVGNHFGGTGAGAGGGAFGLSGDNMSLTRLVSLDPAPNTGCFGIRIMGGAGVNISYCHIRAGDQAIAGSLTVNAPTGCDRNNLNLTNYSVTQTYVKSLASQGLALALVNDGTGTMSCSITGVTLAELIGEATNFGGILVFNKDSAAGAISSVAMKDIYFNGTSDSANPAVSSHNLAGGVNNLTTSNIVFKSAANTMTSNVGGTMVDLSGVSFM